MDTGKKAKEGVYLAMYSEAHSVSYANALSKGVLFELDLRERGIAVDSLVELSETTNVMDLAHVLPACAVGQTTGDTYPRKIVYLLLDAQRHIIDVVVL